VKLRAYLPIADVKNCGAIYLLPIRLRCRSQCPRGLRHELFSPAQTLGSWVRILLEAWMSVYVYSVCR
jgi:hypothetical protein